MVVSQCNNLPPVVVWKRIQNHPIYAALLPIINIQDQIYLWFWNILISLDHATLINKCTIKTTKNKQVKKTTALIECACGGQDRKCNEEERQCEPVRFGEIRRGSAGGAIATSGGFAGTAHAHDVWPIECALAPRTLVSGGLSRRKYQCLLTNSYSHKYSRSINGLWLPDRLSL